MYISNVCDYISGHILLLYLSVGMSLRRAVYRLQHLKDAIFNTWNVVYDIVLTPSRSQEIATRIESKLYGIRQVPYYNNLGRVVLMCLR